MSWIIAAADVSTSESSQPIVVALISALGAVLVAVVTGLVAVARRESADRQTIATPTLGERTAVLERRADDTDDTVDLLDKRQDRSERRIDRFERYMERTDPDHWRRD